MDLPRLFRGAARTYAVVGTAAVVAASAWVTWWIYDDPVQEHEAATLLWPAGLPLLAAAGLLFARRSRPLPVLGVGFAILAASLLGAWSIGLVYLPAALLFLTAGGLLGLERAIAYYSPRA